MCNPLPSAHTSTADPAQSCSSSAGRGSRSGAARTRSSPGLPVPAVPQLREHLPGSCGCSQRPSWAFGGRQLPPVGHLQRTMHLPPEEIPSKREMAGLQLRDRLGKQLCFTLGQDRGVVRGLFAASIQAGAKNAVPHHSVSGEPTSIT